MNKIEVAILNEAHGNPAGMMIFLAKLTQRGHSIKTMADLTTLYKECVDHLQSRSTASKIAQLPHGTIKRFAPITIAVVGASRRFLSQARTHQVGVDFVSASLQYSNYSGEADFVVPYELLNPEIKMIKDDYLKSCNASMETYSNLISYGISNDTAGYAAPQSLRNILILNANHQAWDYFIRTRACSRNTDETQLVATRIWELLRNSSVDGDLLFANSGPDCVSGKCREGSMSCGKPLDADPTTNLLNNLPLLKGQIDWK